MSLHSEENVVVAQLRLRNAVACVGPSSEGVHQTRGEGSPACAAAGRGCPEHLPEPLTSQRGPGKARGEPAALWCLMMEKPQPLAAGPPALLTSRCWAGAELTGLCIHLQLSGGPSTSPEGRPEPLPRTFCSLVFTPDSTSRGLCALCALDQVEQSGFSLSFL